MAEVKSLERFNTARPLDMGWVLTTDELGVLDSCLASAGAAISKRNSVESVHGERAPTQIIVLNYGQIQFGGQMHTGDKFENITQSIIATRQSIATGIVQVESSGQKQLAGALSQLEGAISQAREGEMSAADKKEALELLNEVTKHAASPGRSAAVTKSLADGLWE